MPKTTDPEAQRLIREGARLTARMRRSERTYEADARARARIWKTAHDEHGVSYRDLAEPAGLHHSKVVTAIERYERSEA